MNLDDYQDAAFQYALARAKCETYMVLGLASEAGEIAGKVAKFIRGDGLWDKEAILDELGDVQWMVAGLASVLKVPLSQVAERNLAKLKSRAERGTLQGNGDER